MGLHTTGTSHDQTKGKGCKATSQGRRGRGSHVGFAPESFGYASSPKDRQSFFDRWTSTCAVIYAPPIQAIRRLTAAKRLERVLSQTIAAEPDRSTSRSGSPSSTRPSSRPGQCMESFRTISPFCMIQITSLLSRIQGQQTRACGDWASMLTDLRDKSISRWEHPGRWRSCSGQSVSTADKDR